MLDPTLYDAQIESGFALPDELPAVANTVVMQRLEVMEHKQSPAVVNGELVGASPSPSRHIRVRSHLPDTIRYG